MKFALFAYKSYHREGPAGVGGGWQDLYNVFDKIEEALDTAKGFPKYGVDHIYWHIVDLEKLEIVESND